MTLHRCLFRGTGGTERASPYLKCINKTNQTNTRPERQGRKTESPHITQAALATKK